MQGAKNHSRALSHLVFKVVSTVADKLGLETYVIGGFVRDYLLGKSKTGRNDIDIVTVGNGIDLARAVADSFKDKPKLSVFKRFGTAMLKTQGVELEFVGARKESYSEDSRKPAVENGSLQDDQNRRDFTINALALGLNSDNFGELLDSFDGVKDLENHIIRTPLDPDLTYSDDPLRMLRAVRFAAQLSFEIEKGSLEAIHHNRKRIKIVSAERIVDELNKILLTPKPSAGFGLLYKTGLLHLILPELTRLQGVDEVEGQRHKNNFWHTLEVVDNIAPHTEDLWLRWAALLHDIGKAPTKRFDKKLGWTFHGHEVAGTKMVFRLFKRLRMPLNDKMKYVQKLVYMSSRPIAISGDVTDSAVRRLVFDAGDHIDDLMTLCEADITTKNPRRFRQYHNNFKRVRKKIKEVEERDRIRNFQPPVSGEEIMETFKLKPSREVGLIKNAIKEAILEGEIPNDYEAAKAFMFRKAEEFGVVSL